MPELDFLMPGNPVVNMVILFVVVIVAVYSLLVPLFFISTWLRLQPEAGRGSLVPKGKGDKAEKSWGQARYIPQNGALAGVGRKMKGKTLNVLPSLAQDLAGGFNPAEGIFIALDSRLCAYDDGRRVHYRHKDMVRAALMAGLGRSYWLAALGWSAAASSPLFLGLMEKPGLLDKFQPLEPALIVLGVFVVFLVLFMIMWRGLAWLRANTLVRRVEAALARLDKNAGRAVPPEEKNPLRLTALAALAAVAAMAAGAYGWLFCVTPLVGDLQKGLMDYILPLLY